MDSDNRTGEVILLNLPYTPGDGSTARQGLIVADADTGAAEGGGGRYIVADIVQEDASSACGEFSVPVGMDDVEEGSIQDGAVVRLNRTMSVEEGWIVRSNVARLKKEATARAIKAWARLAAKSYYRSVHLPGQNSRLTPGTTKINYAGRVFDEKEMANLVDASLDFWLTSGPYAERFEKSLAEYLGVRYCSLVNSGSSANLLAFMALTSPKLGERRVARGDEVITVAAAFPTTVAPIVQYGAVPVFVDVCLPTYNIDCSMLESALSEKTKAVMLAHTLGNPFDLEAVKAFCDRHGLWLIEDNCDALGSRYLYGGEWRYTGTIGDIGTSSFYPPHHMTTGEGGAVYTDIPELKRIVESFRDWGRDCWCPPGRDNTCRNRFTQQFGELPFGYDHKYVYSHFGYNLKATDMQAAIGCAQLEKLPDFVDMRKKNWRLLREGLSDLAHLFVLPEPTPHSDPSWFGFLLTVREEAAFGRDEIVSHLESKGIQTRMLFAGNLVKHPCFDEMRKNGKGYRVADPAQRASSACGPVMPVTERIMNSSFWVGVYPGLSEEMIDYTVTQIRNFGGRTRRHRKEKENGKLF